MARRAVEYEVRGLDETLDDLEAILANAREMAAIHLDVAQTVRGWQVRHFDKAEDSSGRSWAPHSELTQALRGDVSAQLLQDTGALKASIALKFAHGRGWSIGTAKVYAAVHQYGAVIRPKRHQHLFIPARGAGRTRSFSTAEGVVAITRARIPAREFLYLNPEEREELVEIYASEVASRGTAYIAWEGLRGARA